MKGIVRFTGGGALLLAIIGLIIITPLSASERGARHGNGPQGGIEFFTIVLDLSDSQAEELEPILAEHREKIGEFRGKGRMQGRQAMRMKRMHRNDGCDNVDQVEMQAKMRRQRRESEKNREEMRKRVDRNREELDEKLAKVLDDDQMEKYLKLRELREERSDQRREHRQNRRGRKI